MPALGPATNSRPAPKPRRVAVPGGVIEYQVRRSVRRRKTIQISVRDGAVVLAAPYRTPNRQLEELVVRRAAWILKHLARREAVPEPPALVSGAKLPYRGRWLELAVSPALADRSGAPEVSRERGQLRVSLPSPPAGADPAALVGAALLGWYREETEAAVAAEVRRWWPRLGRGGRPEEHIRVHIRNQKRRWGSCSRDGSLRFNLRLAMLEPALTEYVVVHELAHLTYMNHSPDFWNLVREHLPDVQERRRRLREADRALPRW